MTVPPKPMIDLRRMLTTSEHEQRLTVARRIAEWRLGSAGWADEIVGAYLYPDAAAAQVDFEQGEKATP